MPETMRAARQHEFGGPEVLRVEEAPLPEPDEGEVRIRVRTAGVNFADLHQGEGRYVHQADLPLTPGAEVCGVREDTGERVVAMCGTGGYAEAVVVPADRCAPVPDDLDDAAALALLVQGLTAWHLHRTCLRTGLAGGPGPTGGDVGAGPDGGSPAGHGAGGAGSTGAGGAPAAGADHGDRIVVMSAGGGVGSLAVQLARPMGAGRVIAVASRQEHRELALELGADVAIDAEPDGLGDRLREAGGGAVDGVIEMRGGRSFDAALRALDPFGRIVVCGIGTKEQNEIRSGHLLRHSRSVVGFWLFHCLERPREMVVEPLRDLYARAARGELRAVTGDRWPLEEAAAAQEAVAAGRTRGKVVLDVG